MTLGTEHTVNPAILMLRNSHIIDICGGNHIVRHRDGFIPEAEVIDAVRRLSHCKEALTICSLHTNHKHILTIPLDGT